MNRSTLLLSLLLLTHGARFAFGHGDPIVVGVTDDQLTVSHISNSFPPLVFAEDDEDGAPDEFINELPVVGQIVFWGLPGLNVAGMDNNSSLSIEPLVRNVKDAAPVEARLVWHWNPVSELVEAASVDFYFLGTGQRFTALPATSTVAPAPFLLANTMAGQQGFHNHNLVQWALANDPPAPTGAYGVFARLVASEHGPSEPFLMVFNNGLEGELMVAAASAINDAAVGLSPGDFNGDGIVDAADYTVWRDGLGSTYTHDHYDEWKTHFGQLAGGAAAAATASLMVPEPARLAHAACGLLGLLAGRTICRVYWRRRSQQPLLFPATPAYDSSETIPIRP